MGWQVRTKKRRFRSNKETRGYPVVRAAFSGGQSCQGLLRATMVLAKTSIFRAQATSARVKDNVLERLSLRRFTRPTLPRLAHLRQHRCQKLAGIAPRRLDDIFRRAPGDDFATAVAAFG